MSTYTARNFRQFFLIFITWVFSALLLFSCVSYRETPGQVIDSGMITTQVKTKLLADEYVSGLPITVFTNKRVVYLTGYVKNRREMYRAIRIANSVPAVIAVKNNLQIH